ncbi:MAG: hypothetical protein AAGG01_24435, partial [Planctomycetota bacterium]
MTGFLEHTLGLGWMVGGWVLLRVMGVTEAVEPPREGRGRLFIGIVVAAALGVISVLPVYADLYLDLMASTRLDSVHEFGRVLEGRVWPSIFAVVVSGAAGMESFSVGAGLFALVVLGAVRAGGAGGSAWNGWYWFGTAAFMAAATSHSQVHAWASFLGLGMSSWPPVLTVLLPATYLVGLGLHDVFTPASPSHRRRQSVIVALTLAAGAAGHVVSGRPFDRAFDGALLAVAAVSAMLLCLVLSVPRARTGAASLLVPLVLLLPEGWIKARNLVAWEDRAAIHTESELSRELQLRTKDGSRYVWVSDRPVRGFWMPPNIDAILKTRGLQSYDHLPTDEFHSLVEPVRPLRERVPYIRRFTRLAEPSDLLEDRLALAGLGTILSRWPLDPALATIVKKIDMVTVSEPLQKYPPRFTLPLESCVPLGNGEWRIELDAVEKNAEPAAALEDRSDAVRLDVSASRASSGRRLLFLS